MVMCLAPNQTTSSEPKWKETAVNIVYSDALSLSQWIIAGSDAPSLQQKAKSDEYEPK